MRSPPNDMMTLWNSYGAGGPTIPLATFACRKVIKNQISDVDFPFTAISGYLTFDPPNLITAGAAVTLGLRSCLLDYRFSSPISIASIPGVFFFPWEVEEVIAHGDHYFRVWVIDQAWLP